MHPARYRWSVFRRCQSGSPAMKVSVRDLDPATIPRAPAGLTGRVSLEIEASAANADPGALEGRVDFQELEVAFNKLTLAQHAPSRIRIGSGAATVERLALAGSAGTVVASGTVGLAGQQSVDLKVDGTLHAAVVSALTAKVRTDGTVKWTLAAHGSARAPELSGSVDL